VREEYDFASMKGGVRAKYVKSFQGKATTVLLDSDVAEMFPDSESVNEAFRILARVLQHQEKDAQQQA
jgi:transcription elongation factor GreA-like protein